MKKLAAILSLLFAVLPAACGGAHDIRPGGEAYLRGDYPVALGELQPLAEKGDPIAQDLLGTMYLEGRGVSRDEVEAVKWFRRAATQGYAPAQTNLAIIHEKGEVVWQDYIAARNWYFKAADQGYAAAQLNLGYMYEKGRGVPRDDVEAVKWYRRAAEGGNAQAQHNLGFMYSYGRGVSRDDKAAARWYTRAAEQGHTDAVSSLAFLHRNGRGVPENHIQAYKWAYIAFYFSIVKDRRDVDVDKFQAFLRSLGANPVLAPHAANLSYDEVLEAEALAREWLVKYRR